MSVVHAFQAAEAAKKLLQSTKVVSKLGVLYSSLEKGNKKLDAAPAIEAMRAAGSPPKTLSTQERLVLETLVRGYLGDEPAREMADILAQNAANRDQVKKEVERRLRSVEELASKVGLVAHALHPLLPYDPLGVEPGPNRLVFRFHFPDGDTGFERLQEHLELWASLLKTVAMFDGDTASKERLVGVERGSWDVYAEVFLRVGKILADVLSIAAAYLKLRHHRNKREKQQPRQWLARVSRRRRYRRSSRG